MQQNDVLSSFVMLALHESELSAACGVSLPPHVMPYVPVVQMVEGSKLQLVPVDLTNGIQQKSATPVPAASPAPHTRVELVSVGSAPLVHEKPWPLHPETVALVHVCPEGALLLDEHATRDSDVATKTNAEIERRDFMRSRLTESCSAGEHRCHRSLLYTARFRWVR